MPDKRVWDYYIPSCFLFSFFLVNEWTKIQEKTNEWNTNFISAERKAHIYFGNFLLFRTSCDSVSFVFSNENNEIWELAEWSMRFSPVNFEWIYFVDSHMISNMECQRDNCRLLRTEEKHLNKLITSIAWMHFSPYFTAFFPLSFCLLFGLPVSIIYWWFSLLVSSLLLKYQLQHVQFLFSMDWMLRCRQFSQQWELKD